MLDIHTLDKLKEVDGKELQTEDDAILPASTLMAGLRAGSPARPASKRKIGERTTAKHPSTSVESKGAVRILHPGGPPPRRLLKSSMINGRKSSARAWQVGGRNAWHKLQEEDEDRHLTRLHGGPALANFHGVPALAELALALVSVEAGNRRVHAPTPTRPSTNWR
jgi:hypothetical protein